MAKLIFDSHMYLLAEPDGSISPVLNLFNPIENASAIPMHVLTTDASGQLMPVYFLEDHFLSVIEALPQPPAPSQIILLLRIIPTLLKKYRPCRFLLVGEQPGYYPQELASFLSKFHPQNQFLSFNSVTEANNHLQPASFNCIILNDTADSQLTTDLINIAILLCKPFGTVLIASNDSQHIRQAKELFTDYQIFVPDDGVTIIEAVVTPQLCQRILQAPSASILSSEKLHFRTELTDIYNCLSDNVPDYNNIIKRTASLESDLLHLYPQLVSQDIKYLLNRFKETLINLHLNLGNLSEVQTAYALLTKEMHRFNDFYLPKEP